MEHELLRPQEIVCRETPEMVGQDPVQFSELDLIFEDEPEDGRPHLGVGEVPLAQGTFLTQMGPEAAPEVGEARLLPGLAGAGR